MTVWIITEDGERLRLVDKFTHRIYVSGKFLNLKNLAEKVEDNPQVAGCRFIEKHESFMKASKKKVLEISMSNHRNTLFFASQILQFGGYEKFRLYNVDIPVSQAYLYEKEIFPLAHVLVINSGKDLFYAVLGSVTNVCYDIPPFRSMWLNVYIKKKCTQKAH